MFIHSFYSFCDPPRASSRTFDAINRIFAFLEDDDAAQEMLQEVPKSKIEYL